MLYTTNATKMTLLKQSAAATLAHRAITASVLTILVVPL
jgi:hypothetical protein